MRGTRAIGVLGLAAGMLLAGVALPERSAQAVTRPVVAVVGDSYAGWPNGAVSQDDAWWHSTANDLGWTVGNVVADPGAGFLRPGDYGTLATALRNHPIPASTNYVLVQGGINDSDQNPDAIPQGVADLLAVVHQQAPNAVPIVIGMLIPGAQGMTANRLAVARALGDYRGLGDTRYIIGDMCTFAVGPDGTHPTADGDHAIGDYIAWHAAHAVQNSSPLHLDPSGSYYTV
jgi:hypothetical protein